MRYFNLKLTSISLFFLLTVANPAHATMISAPGLNPSGSGAANGDAVDRKSMLQFIASHGGSFVELFARENQSAHFRIGPISDYSNYRSDTVDAGKRDALRYENEDVIGNCATHCTDRQHIEVSAVPLPAAVWMLLSGLMAMGVAVRRRFDITS